MSKPNVGKAKARAPIYEQILVGGEDITAEIDSIYHELKINGNDLTNEAKKHAALFARVAFMAEEAASEMRYAKRELELSKALINHAIRRRALDSGERLTEDGVKNAVIMDDEIVALTSELLIVERNAGMLNGLRQSLRDRREMLAELQRDARHEAAGFVSE